MNSKLSALKVFVRSQKDRSKRIAFSLRKFPYVSRTKKLFPYVGFNIRHFHVSNEDIPWIRQGLLLSAFLTIGIGSIIGFLYAFTMGLEFVVAGGIVFVPWALLSPTHKQIVKPETENTTELKETREIQRLKGTMEYEIIPLDFGVKAEGHIWHDPEGKFPDSVIIKAPEFYIHISHPDPNCSGKDIEITVKGQNKVLVSISDRLLDGR